MQNTAQTAPSGQKPQAAAPATQAAPQRPKPVPPPEFQSAKIDALSEPDLIAILKAAETTTFQKAKACQRLSTLGTKEAVPALAALLKDPQLSTYARYGLQPIADPSVDDALRNGLTRVKGTLLVGIINSIGYRKDTKAVAPLSKLVYDSDAEVARAAAAALGHISGTQSASALREALRRTKEPVRSAVADGCLLCAEGLLLQGERDQGLALYNTLTASDVPKPARLAAMHGIIGAETSPGRPRSR